MDPDAIEITGDACRVVGDAGILRSFADALASRAKKEKKSQVDKLMFLQEHAVAQLVNGEYGALNKVRPVRLTSIRFWLKTTGTISVQVCIIVMHKDLLHSRWLCSNLSQFSACSLAPR